MIVFMIIIRDQIDDKKMEYGSINIHSPFHCLDARLLHEKFNHATILSSYPSSSFHDETCQNSSFWILLVIIHVKAIPFHQPDLLLTCGISC